MKLNESIKSLREKNNLTQQELADQLYVSRQTVCRWENASRCPDLVMAKKLANIFNVSLDELISDEDIAHLDKNNDYWKKGKFRDRQRLQEYQKKLLTFIETIGTVFLLLSVILRTQFDMRVPVWCAVVGLIVVGVAFILNHVVLKKLHEL